MSPRRSHGKKIVKALLPILLLPVMAALGYGVWVVRKASRPPQREHLMSPEVFAHISPQALKVTETNWQNSDGTSARGWILKGAEGAPAVIMLHRFGGDRSWVFNLGIKLSESGANYTVLWPDLRAHGRDAPVENSTFGPREANDVRSAIEYLKGLQSPQGRALVGPRIGVYGVELGAYAALLAGREEGEIHSLALDSIPLTSEDALYNVVKEQTGFDNGLIRALTRAGAWLYYMGDFKNVSSCTVAEGLGDKEVLLLSGDVAPELRASTETLSKCFPNPSKVKLHSDLAVTGFNVDSATALQSESYATLIIDFFKQTLAPAPAPSPQV